MGLVTDAGDTCSPELHKWFKTIMVSWLTLFECLVGGVDWDHIIELLIVEINPWMGVLFCFYISVGLFILLNMVTGIFVDKAMNTAREEHDAQLAIMIKNNFFGEVEDGDVNITWEEFRKVMDCEEMRSYFRDMKIDIGEARGLFDLIDCDGSNSVSADEIVRGCLRLRGPAKSLDLALLIQTTLRLHNMMEDFVDNMDSHLGISDT